VSVWLFAIAEPKNPNICDAELPLSVHGEGDGGEVSLLSSKHVLAIDLGAESGRVIKVGFDGTQLGFDVIHRFSNTPVTAGGTLYWDVLRLWHQIETGVQAGLTDAASIGIDTWGVDGALLDRNGKLLSNPVHYRDRRNEGMLDWVFERVPKRTLFARTGIQFIQFNGIFQLASLIRDNSPLFEIADTFLPIADLFNYWLCGSKTSEFTHVTTQQAYNPHTGDWDWETLDTLGIPRRIFGDIVQPGTTLGDYQGIPVIAPATHDTGSAVVAVPAITPHFAYISSGTWSLIGFEIDTPIINDDSYAANVTNEGGFGGKFRFLKNCMGLWLAQQSKATWAAAGQDYEYDHLAREAQSAPAFRSLFDVDDPSFLQPGDMPARIRTFCERSGQPQPQTVGEVMRSIYESLAFKYRFLLERMSALCGQRADVIHIVGGGSQNALLNQMTADATGCVVKGGPSEATALGNAIVQLIALGELGDVGQAREMLHRSMSLTTFEPRQTAAWDAEYERFKSIVTTV
jgi:rhamnulokinase